MILIGDVREQLKELLDRSVNCCVTSPPYWGLRDYGTASWEGGDPNCSHKRDSKISSTGFQNQLQGSVGDGIHKLVCGNCGAVRRDSQIGLEQTPDEYVEQMVAVFREVKRVLSDEGTLWLNLGDTYNGAKVGNTNQNVGAKRHANKSFSKPLWNEIKPKDLVGIPWRVAFALQADGWYLRQDIIWAKPNPMPESVTDRCTKSHEYIFLLSKSPKYYFDHNAIKEPAIWAKDKRADKGRLTYEGKRQGEDGTGQEAFVAIKETRNKRDVWTVSTKPFKGAHFATFPPDLIEPCILAGCPEGGTVLDPFFGAGTTGLVAQRHNRNWIGCELNPEYAAIATARIESEANLFTKQVTNEIM